MKRYNNDSKQGFIIEYVENMKDESIETIKNIFKIIENKEVEINKDLAFFNSYELAELFTENNWSSDGSIAGKKGIIRNYMRYYRKNNLQGWEDVDIINTINLVNRDNVKRDSVLETEFFKDEKDVENTIEAALDIFDGIDEGIYDVAIAAINLAFLGVEVEDAVVQLKADISRTNNKIKVTKMQKEINTSRKAIRQLRNYADSDGYEYIFKGVVAKTTYKDTEYLLRSNTKEQLSVNNIRTYLTNFSKLANENVGKIFKYNRLLLSGRFCRLIQEENNLKEVDCNFEGFTRQNSIGFFEKEFKIVFKNEDGNPSVKFYGVFLEFLGFKETYYGTVD